jgi:hypothetical protein
MMEHQLRALIDARSAAAQASGFLKWLIATNAIHDLHHAQAREIIAACRAVMETPLFPSNEERTAA